MHLGARGVMKNEVVDSGRVRGVWDVLGKSVRTRRASSRDRRGGGL